MMIALMFAIDLFHAPSIGELAIILAIAMLLFGQHIPPTPSLTRNCRWCCFATPGLPC